MALREGHGAGPQHGGRGREEARPDEGEGGASWVGRGHRPDGDEGAALGVVRQRHGARDDLRRSRALRRRRSSPDVHGPPVYGEGPGARPAGQGGGGVGRDGAEALRLALHHALHGVGLDLRVLRLVEVAVLGRRLVKLRSHPLARRVARHEPHGVLALRPRHGRRGRGRHPAGRGGRRRGGVGGGPERVGLEAAARRRQGGGGLQVEAGPGRGQGAVDAAFTEAVGEGRELHELQSVLGGGADEAVALQHLAALRAARDGGEDGGPLAVGAPGHGRAERNEAGRLLARRGVDGGDAPHRGAQRQRGDGEEEDAAGVADILQGDAAGQDGDVGEDALDVVVVVDRVALQEGLLHPVQPFRRLDGHGAADVQHPLPYHLFLLLHHDGCC